MVKNHMPHKAERRREPKPWVIGLLKFSISLFAMIPFYFFICGFFTPSMPRRRVGDRRLHARCALLVLLVLTVVAPGSLSSKVNNYRQHHASPCRQALLQAIRAAKVSTMDRRGRQCKNPCY